MKKVVIGILAHVDAGKTTLSEAMLFTSGRLRKLGRVDRRDCFLDNADQERERGITIFSKQALFSWKDTEFTLLDTPGHADFSSETERALRIMDYAVLVISGTDGTQSHTETLRALLESYRVPAFIFVTKMDVARVPESSLMEDLKEHISENCISFSSQGEDFYEQIAMLDEQVLDSYMATGEISDGDIARLVASRKLFPCFFGSGLKLGGVEAFLDSLARYTLQPPYPDAFGAKVYKISRDSRGVRLTYMKITGGELRVKAPVRYLPLNGEPLDEKADEIRMYSGSKYVTAESAAAGSVCAVTGLSLTRPGQGLGIEDDSDDPLLEPVLVYSLVLPSGTDALTMLPKLRTLEEEDPQLHILWDPLLREISIQLMGVVQTDVIKGLIRERFGTEVGISEGHILYKETIASVSEGIGHYEPLRHYAETHLLLEPGEPGSGLVFDSACPTDSLDLNWQRLILTHLEEKQHVGVLTGSPITDMRITLIAGKAHLKHTEGGDFRQATYRAVRHGLMNARSVLLEPIFEYRLEVPPESIGRAINDIRAMGGEHSSPEPSGPFMMITGTAPVAGMADYMTEVMAYTSGKGRFSCRSAGYRPCENAADVIAKAAYDPEADLENPPGSVFCAHGAGFNVKWNDVSSCCHIPPLLRSSAPAHPLSTRNVLSQPAGSASRGITDIDEKELEAIMEREFGPIRRRSYSRATVFEGASSGKAVEGRPERLIIDGYNVIFGCDDLKAVAAKSIDAARERLIDTMASYSALTGTELAVVFDAYRVPGGQGSRFDTAGIHIAYTKEGESADMYIERLAGEIGKNENVRVITSDSLIRLAALRSGVMRTSVKEFMLEVEGALELMRKKMNGKK